MLEVELEIKKAKEKYFEDIKKKMIESGCNKGYYQAAKLLGAREAPHTGTSGRCTRTYLTSR